MTATLQTATPADTEDGERTPPDVRYNRMLEDLSAEERAAWALEHLPGAHVLTSSFGAQAAVSLHLLTRLVPDLPVVLIDTGYLFAETYRFIDDLRERFALNLKVYRSAASPAWQEARHGQRWRNGVEGIEAYHQENKVEPMRRALGELGVRTWFAGLRRQQSESRAGIPFLSAAAGRWKVCPIADWNDRDVHRYLTRHRLPYHPLVDRGYLSIGDRHSTSSIFDVANIEELRNFGLKRECGIHELDG
jgi:phosphoadenosine phosphosulfate reductase